MPNLHHFLQSGLDILNLELPQKAQEEIIEYVELLNKWNKIHNLTAISDPKTILIKHIFDSLAIAPFIIGPDILDFGTGAGLPGIPLALMFPKWNFVLLDSVGKKTTFLSHVVLSLSIKNVKIVNKRIEEFRFDNYFATIVTRATTDIRTIIDKTKHLCAKSGQILVMKGKYPEDELSDITESFESYRIKVPYLDEERHIIKLLNLKG